eukprot:4402268-Lingulodinium_polyedra.AAC.1
MSIILGHVTWALLVRREALAFLSCCYAYVEAAGSRRCRVWPRCLAELGRASALLPLLRGDLGAEWRPTTVA